MLRLVLAVSFSAGLPAQQGKLDAGIAGDGHHEVFVRMADQLCGTGAAFTEFCKQHAGAKRRELRGKVLAELKGKSERSFAKVAERVGKLGDGVQDVQRYWIVNGFACRATAAACAALAEDEAVAFVYRKPVPGLPALHRVVQRDRPRLREACEVAAKQALAVLAETEPALDPAKLTPSWNLERIRVGEAWQRGAMGQGVVIAMLDTGLLPTPALLRALWRNEREEWNGEDDDGNGFVDDLFGYDFQNGQGLSIGEFGRATHGSMCGGILAGRPVEIDGKLFAGGIAPRAKLMVLRGMGFLRAYEYAVAHGADVLSMSYMWVNMELGDWRGLYRTAHEHMTAAGVVSVGGSGNFQDKAPAGRQICLPKDIPCVISASGLDKQDELPRFSSLGPCTWSGVRFYDDFPADQPLVKPDVTAFSAGFAVWMPVTERDRPVYHDGKGCGLKVGPQGNSFAGPHAGGVAALMLGANPDLPAWQVKERMEASCRDLGEKGRDVRYGAGLLDAVRSLEPFDERPTPASQSSRRTPRRD